MPFMVRSLPFCLIRRTMHDAFRIVSAFGAVREISDLSLCTSVHLGQTTDFTLHHILIGPLCFLVNELAVSLHCAVTTPNDDPKPDRVPHVAANLDGPKIRESRLQTGEGAPNMAPHPSPSSLNNTPPHQVASITGCWGLGLEQVQ